MMSENIAEFRHKNAAVDKDDTKDGLTCGDLGKNSTAEENLYVESGTFEEDGDAGSPSIFQSQRFGDSINPVQETKVVASVKPTANISSSNQYAVSDRRIPATSTMAPSFPKSSSMPPSVFNSFKTWSLNTFKYTKQYVAERLGQSPRTVDPETESRVEALRETQRQYLHILRLARTMYIHFQRMVQTQRILGDAFGDLAQKNSELVEHFTYNAETQKLLSRNGDILLGALNVFMTGLSTLCNTTIEDTMSTVKNYEAARVKYDAEKHYLENLRLHPRDPATMAKVQDAERIFQRSKQYFDRLHNDVIIKLRFLDENKVNVCQKHLYLLHKGFVNYVAGNREGVEDVLKRIYDNSPQLTNDLPASDNATTSMNLSLNEIAVAASAGACHAASNETFQLPSK